MDDGIEFLDFSSEFGPGPVQLYSLVLQEVVESIFFESECTNLAFIVGFGGFEFFLLGLVLDVAVFKFFFVSDDEVLILMDLSFKFGLAVDDLIFLIISHLVSFDGEMLHLSGPVVDDFLELADFSIE